MDKDKYIGRLLDNRYEILEVLGTGGMAVVYKARCHRLNRLVAIKILKDDFSQDEDFRRRFHAESRAVAMLSHPNIVSVYDVSTSDDADYIVMELIDGITLKQYMEKKGVLNWKETLHFAIQIGKALDHAHSRGIVHRDIKPHNVMVLKNGSVKVTDFGIARVMSKSNTLTKEALGSVHYISPEQAKGGRVDNRSDIYSLGIVMYEMMTGRPPYDGESPVAIAIQHINGKPQMPSTLNPNIPGGLEQIIVKAISREPAKRYETAGVMLQDMDEFRKDPTILFDYNNPSTELEDAAAIASQRKAEPAVTPPPRNTAERVVARTGETPVRRQTPAKNKPAAKPARRRREEVIEDEERSSKVATIAVVMCSAVAIIAIGIFLVMLLSGGGGGQEQNLVVVPNLVNKDFNEAAMAKDYVLKIESKIYSNQFEKDRIVEQKIRPNSKIEKGSEVLVVVSAGPEPTVKVMENLVNLDEEQALKFLTNTQGISEDRILIRRESHATVEAGKIIKTEPVDGTALADNQTIYLTVSTGPEVESANMPDLVGQNIEVAKKLLEAAGFKNVEVVEVESTKPQGQVIYQSVAKRKLVPTTTKITLRIPKWIEVTVPTEPTETQQPDDYVPKVVEIALPDDMIEDYILTIYNGITVVEERQIPSGTLFTEVVLYGKGKMEFIAEIGTLRWTIHVDFGTGTANG